MSSRGAAGATKPKLHNVNSIYAGKNHTAVKATGLSKHGLQSLGKTTAVVRRMPPPATLPSLRAESQGQDPNVALVPQGGTGWNKTAVIDNTNLSDSTSTLKVGGSVSGSGSNLIGSQSTGQHTTDLRPTWAKPASSLDMNAVATQNATAVTASVRDFPSLAAATASAGKQSSALLNDSLKPQKSGSWRAGGGSAQSKNEGEEVTPSQMRSVGNIMYPSSNSQPRNTERQLPSRYYDGSDAYSPPSGTYQIPKQAQGIVASAGSRISSENRYQMQEDTAIRVSQPVNVPISSSNAVMFPANVAVPPPNYSQPPPNFQPLQLRKAIYTQPQVVAQTAVEGESLGMEEVQDVMQKNGLGDAGYREEGAKNGPTNLSDNQDQTVPMASHVDNAERPSREGNEKQDKSHLQNDRHPRLMGDMDWPSSQYNYMDREAESRRWRNAGGGGQDPDSHLSENTQFHYGREHEEDFGRRENVEREAAIERSRRKRRTANQSSLPSESESGTSSAYDGGRTVSGFDNDVCPEWDPATQQNSYAQFSSENTGYGEKVNGRNQHWGVRYEGSDYDSGRRESKKHDEAEAIQKSPEYKVLRRPESRESAELPQRISQVSLQDEVEDEEDELQLTKLAHGPAKVVKRMPPSLGAVQQVDGGKSSTSQDSSLLSTQQPPPASVPSQRAQPRGNSDKRKSESSMKRQDGFNDASIQRTGERDRKSRVVKDDRSRDDQAQIANAKMAAPSAIVVAPLPTDNVWEKRAEEREVAQRSAKKDFVDATHFPAFAEESKSDDFTSRSAEAAVGNNFMRKDTSRSDISTHKQRANKHRNQNWSESTYPSGYFQFDAGDIYGQDDDEESGQLFRGQREFVNSRVSAHHRARGGLTVGGRETKGRSAISGLRRGTSIPRQTNIRGRRVPLHHTERNEKFPQRRSKRQEEHVPEQEDNFANMGEFRVEDTYTSLASIDEKPTIEDPKKEEGPEGPRRTNGERRGGRSQKNHTQRAQQFRSAPQYYQPRSQNEEYNGRSSLRGNNRTRGAIRRNEPYSSGNGQNFSERGKRKKDFPNKHEDGREKADDENKNSNSIKEDNPRDKKTINQQARFQGNSGSRAEGSPSTQAVTPADRVSHVKSPVTSEGQEEWETASESSDIAERQKTQKRNVVMSTKFSNRRVRRTVIPPRREAGGESGTTRTNHSKNAKPASTTLHAAARGGQSHNQEVGQVTNSEPHRREGACRDGLAGLDINGAGVIIIDELRDVENVSGEPGEDGDDDFMEVISKKNRRIRQQQMNEQLEAERRKQREKEKEKRKIRLQSKKMEKKVVGSKDGKALNANATNVSRGVSEAQNNGSIGSGLVKNSPTVLNTTVWNSSIVKEQGLPPLDNHPVIPSPIARPVHKTGVSTTSSSNVPNAQKTVEAWTRPDEEQRQTMSKKLDDASSNSSVKKSTVEFAASFNSPPTRPESSQYDFTFDPSLQTDSQHLPSKNSSKTMVVSGDRMEGNSLKSLSVEQNDDERLKEKLDKVKDFWPGQQFANTLLENAVAANTISQLNEKSQAPAAGSGSLHGPNVAKVRPQPQSNDTCGTSVPLKESVSTSSASVLPSPSPCVPQGTYLQSLAQVPPPPFSMIFGEPFSLHSATSPPAQALFNGGVSASQGPITRSRPTSFIEHSQLFVHPPPTGSASSSLTWSNTAPQLELLSGLNPTPSLSSQSRPTSVQRFQFPSQAPSGSTFGTPPPVISGAAKLSHIAPPPHSHQVPPPLHPPHSFMPPPPHEFFPPQGSGLGPVGSQRGTDISSQAAASGGLTRNSVGMLGQVPPPHMQHISFQPQSPSAFGLPGATTFSQVPPIHPFTGPPPPLRFPPVQTVGNDVGGIPATNWSKTALSSVSLKFPNGACNPNVVALDRNGGRNAGERWNMPTTLPQQFHNTFVFQQPSFGKEGNESMQPNNERYSGQCSTEPRRENEGRGSVASSISANGNEAIENSKKTATKV